MMSGEVEIAKWEKGTALPVQLSIPSGTDIVAIGFKNGTVATTEIANEANTTCVFPWWWGGLSHVRRLGLCCRCLRRSGCAVCRCRHHR